MPDDEQYLGLPADREQAKTLLIEKFPPALRRRAKAAAALQGLTLRAWLIHAVEADVARCEMAQADTPPGEVITPA
jgi:hypothetical protein